MTDTILLENYRMPAFQRAIEKMAENGKLIDYKAAPEGETHTKIDFGPSWASYMFELGMKFNEAEN